MTDRQIDDVTGEIIGEGRSYRIAGVLGKVGTFDVVDVDTLLQLVRDHLEGPSPQPLDIYTVIRLAADPVPALAEYAPPKPKPFYVGKPPNDGPFGPINTVAWPEKVPKLTPAFPPPPFPPAPLSYYGGRTREEHVRLVARWEKARARHARALMELCGCGDLDAHDNRDLER